MARTLIDHRTIGQPHRHSHAQDALLLYLLIQQPLQGRTRVGRFLGVGIYKDWEDVHKRPEQIGTEVL